MGVSVRVKKDVKQYVCVLDTPATTTTAAAFTLIPPLARAPAQSPTSQAQEHKYDTDMDTSTDMTAIATANGVSGDATVADASEVQRLREQVASLTARLDGTPCASGHVLQFHSLILSFNCLKLILCVSALTVLFRACCRGVEDQARVASLHSEAGD